MANGRRVGSVGVVVLQGQQLLAIDGHIARCLDAEANFAPIDIDDGDADIVTDVNLFAQFTTQDQHLATLLRAKQWLAYEFILSHESAIRPARRSIFPRSPPPLAPLQSVRWLRSPPAWASCHLNRPL